MEPTTTGPGPVSLQVTGDPVSCREAATELRRLVPAGRDADRLYDTLSRHGVPGFGGLASDALRSSCFTAPPTERVAGDAARLEAGLDRLADDLDSVRDGLWAAADQARAHGLVVTGVPYVDGAIQPPRPGVDRVEQAEQVWAGVCALVAHQRRREIAAQQRWLAVLDSVAGRPVAPVEDVGDPPPGLGDLESTEPDPGDRGWGEPDLPEPVRGGDVRPAGTTGPDGTGGTDPAAAPDVGAESGSGAPRPGSGSVPSFVAAGVLSSASWVRPGWGEPGIGTWQAGERWQVAEETPVAEPAEASESAGPPAREPPVSRPWSLGSGHHAPGRW